MPYKPTGQKPGRPKGKRNSKEVALPPPPEERERVKQNARVHSKIVPSLKITPLEVMLHSMEYYYLGKAAEECRIVFEAAREAHEAAKQQGGTAVMATALDLAKAYGNMEQIRAKAVSCAEKAARFVHPTLSAVAPPPDEQDPDGETIDPHVDRLSDMADRWKLGPPQKKVA